MRSGALSLMVIALALTAAVPAAIGGEPAAVRKARALHKGGDLIAAEAAQQAFLSSDDGVCEFSLFIL